MRRIVPFLLALVFTAVAAGTASADNTVVGADKCAKVCHKIQYTSWQASKHFAAKEKGPECETCHGPGSGYMTMATMKDPAKAKAAGLIAAPGKDTCTKCHKNGVKDEDLPKVHAHKVKA